MDPRLQDIIDRWYIKEPALLKVFFSHELEKNTKISCPFRCGKGKIEYNPTIIESLNDNQLEQYLKAEVIRIILKHPYERQPDGCRRRSMSIGSNLVLADNYDFEVISLPKPSEYGLPENESYEWYSMRIEGKNKKSSNPIASNAASDISTDNDEDISQQSNSEQEETSNDQNQESQNKDDTKDSSGDSSLENSSNSNQGATTAETTDYSREDCFVLKMADGSEIRIPKGKKASKGDGLSQTPGTSGFEGADANTSERNNSLQVSGIGETDGQITKSSKGSGLSQTPGTSGFEGTADPPLENRKFDNEPAKEDLSSLWEEDSMMSCAIDSIIDDIASSGSSSWGSLAGKMSQKIIANTKARIDYRRTLSGFRASILSSKRHLTRMRPNRRSGFDNMGSIRRFDTKILIAVDVSGSISDEVLTHFYSVIGRFFKYGVENVDVVQFDCDLSEVVTFEKKMKRVDIEGRGGTSFQPIFDYVSKHPDYDGLIIFTDGYAPQPSIPKGLRTKVVWICDNEDNYQKHKKWMKKSGRCCTIKL